MSSRREGIIASTLMGGNILLIYAITRFTASSNTRSSLLNTQSQIIYAIVFCGVLTLLGSVLAATAIAREKEGNTWTLLLTTPMTSSRIILGKVLGLGYRMLWPLGLITAHFLVFTIAGVISWKSLILILWLSVTTNTIWLATGLYYSLRFPTVTTAVILNLLTPLLAYGGMMVLLGTIGDIVAYRGDHWVEVVGLYAPYTYLSTGMDYFDRHRHGWPEQCWLPAIGKVHWLSFFAAVAAVGLAHLAAAALLLWHTIRRFDRIVHRAPAV